VSQKSPRSRGLHPTQSRELDLRVPLGAAFGEGICARLIPRCPEPPQPQLVCDPQAWGSGWCFWCAPRLFGAWWSWAPMGADPPPAHDSLPYITLVQTVSSGHRVVPDVGPSLDPTVGGSFVGSQGGLPTPLQCFSCCGGGDNVAPPRSYPATAALLPAQKGLGESLPPTPRHRVKAAAPELCSGLGGCSWHGKAQRRAGLPPSSILASPPRQPPCRGPFASIPGAVASVLARTRVAHRVCVHGGAGWGRSPPRAALPCTGAE